MADDIDVPRLMREIRSGAGAGSHPPTADASERTAPVAPSTDSLAQAIDEIRAGKDLYLTRGMAPTRFWIPRPIRPLLIAVLRYTFAWQTHWNGVAGRALDELLQVVQHMARRLGTQLEDLGRRIRSIERAAGLDPETRRRRRVLDDAYLAFEAKHRGPEGEIRERLAVHAELVQRSLGTEPAPVLDIGCGRGELLEILRGLGVAARGVDANEHMIAACRAKGLDATHADCLEYLASLAAGSLGAATLCQVVEHLTLDQTLELFERLHRALRPGAICIVETPNVENLVTSAYTFHLDLTHARKFAGPALAHVLTVFGFEVVDTVHLSPAPAAQQLRVLGGDDPMAKILDESLLRVNGLLFGPRDVAIVARRTPPDVGGLAGRADDGAERR